jgi:hypothetical protein
MSTPNERMQILDQIERGEISVAEGLRRLEALPEEEGLESETSPAQPEPENPPEAGEAPASEVEAAPKEEEILTQAQPDEAPDSAATEDLTDPTVLAADTVPPDAEKWRQFWMAPLWIGAAVTVLGGWLMYRALVTSGVGFWFVCAALPFAIGCALLALAWNARTAPWLHLRVQQKPGERPQRIAISFPIPVRLTSWLLRNFGKHIPRLEDTALDEVIVALGQTASHGEPVYIQVDEGEAGEKVEIYIG